jgi:hypothetical protein
MMMRDGDASDGTRRCRHVALAPAVFVDASAQRGLRPTPPCFARRLSRGGVCRAAASVAQAVSQVEAMAAEAERLLLATTARATAAAPSEPKEAAEGGVEGDAEEAAAAALAASRIALVGLTNACDTALLIARAAAANPVSCGAHYVR